MFLADFKFSDYRWVPPKKAGVKVVLAFDTFHNDILLWKAQKLNFSDADRQAFPYREKFLSEEFFEELKGVLKLYSSSLQNEKLAGVYLILPDCMVSFDAVTIPQMMAKRRETVLSGHFDNILKDTKSYKMRRYLVAAYKKTYTYLYAYVKAEYIEKIESAMSENKLSPKYTLFSGAARLNGAIHLKPNLKKKNFILLDIREDFCNVSISYRGRCFAFTRIMLGTKDLKNDEVLQENMLYNHDVANLFILNAQEKAKAKKLTVSKEGEGADLEAVADDVIAQLEQGVNLNAREEAPSEEAPSEPSAPQSEALPKTSAPLGYSGPTVLGQPISPLEEETEEEEEETEEEEGEEQIKGKREKVFTRKTPKKLPKYMFREEPTDEKGYVYENFRMFTKWAMLYLKWLKGYEYLGEFDSVVVNMPEKYAYLTEMANREEDKCELPFEFLGKPKESGKEVPIEGIGALFAGVYNLRLNF